MRQVLNTLALAAVLYLTIRQVDTEDPPPATAAGKVKLWAVSAFRAAVAVVVVLVVAEYVWMAWMAQPAP